MRSPEDVIESARQRAIPIEKKMLIDPELLFGKRMLRDIVMMEKPCLSRPAKMQGGAHIVFRPIHHFLELIPVVHLIKFHLLDRSARDDEPVVFVMAYPAEGGVESAKMLLGGVPALVRLRVKKIDFELDGAVGEPPQKMKLGLFLLRHQVEDRDAKRPDVLMLRPASRHHEDVLLRKMGDCRKPVLDLDRHI